MDTDVHVDGHLESDWAFEETLLNEDHCVCVAVKSREANSTKRNVCTYFMFSK